MTGDDLIALAGNLAVNTAMGNSEARFRSAVSRAYYGAYHLACSFLADLGVEIRRNAEGHTEVYRSFARVRRSDAQDVARLLNSLRTARNRADYDLTLPDFGDQRFAIRNVERAHHIRSILNACRDEPTRSEFEAILRQS